MGTTINVQWHKTINVQCDRTIAPGRARTLRLGAPGNAPARGEEGVEQSSRLCVYIHKQPLKKIQSSRGFYPSTPRQSMQPEATGSDRTRPHHANQDRTNTRIILSNTVYHKKSVYGIPSRIPFILYSLKELRLGLNCLMKLLPYGTQSITRNPGLYTYMLNFLLCISTANSKY